MALEAGASDEVVQLMCYPEVMIRARVGIRLQAVCVPGNFAGSQELGKGTHHGDDSARFNLNQV